MARLYHLTSLAHIEKIIKVDKFLKTTESNIGSPEELRPPPPDDPFYDNPMVYVWPFNVRVPDGEKRIPLGMTGEMLRLLEQSGHMYQRVRRSEFEGNGETTIAVHIVVDADPYENITPPTFGTHVGPDVVWLTNDPTPEQDWQHDERIPEDLFMYRKSEVLVVVDVPDEDVHHWPTWSREHGIAPLWYDCLNNADNDAEHWYVVERPIPMSEWVAIYVAKSGLLLWLNPDKHDDVEWNEFGEHGLGMSEERQKELTAAHPRPEVYRTAALRRSM